MTDIFIKNSDIPLLTDEITAAAPVAPTSSDANVEASEKRGASRTEKREPLYANEKIDRPPRFRNSRDILNHLKVSMTERGYARKEDVINDILSGQSPEDRESILRALLSEFSKRRGKTQQEKEAEKPQEEKTARVRLNDKRKMSFKEKREFEQLEKEIAELETEKAQIEEQLCSGALSVDELPEKSKRLPEVKDLIDEKTMRWLELSEIEGRIPNNNKPENSDNQIPLIT